MLNQSLTSYLTLLRTYPHIAADVPGGLPIVTDPVILCREQERLYADAAEKGHPAYWYDLGVVAEDAWVVVLRDLVRFPNGKYGGYIRTINRRSQLERSGKDVVMLVRIQGMFLLLRHFRHEDRMWHWECPRGFGESGLSPEENARKEIQEETGLAVRRVHRLDARQERVAYFLVDCEGTLRQEDGLESISRHITVSADALRQMIARCELDDMYTLRAFALAATSGALTP